jgi:hypothetical protein
MGGGARGGCGVGGALGLTSAKWRFFEKSAQKTFAPPARGFSKSRSDD